MALMDVSSATHGIQLSVAPVFLLTAVAGMIAAVAGRLARIIDRARLVEDRALRSDDPEYVMRAEQELRLLRKRGIWSNVSIGFLTLCGVLIGTTILLLFLAETTQVFFAKMAVLSFMGGVVSFLLALICFLIETWMATRILNFSVTRPGSGSSASR